MPTITISLPATVTELQAEPFERVAGVSGQVPQTVSLTAGAGSIVVAATASDWCWRFTEHGPGYRKTRFCTVVSDAAYAALVAVDPGTLLPGVEPPAAAWAATAASVGRIRVDVGSYPSAVAAVAAAPAGSIVHFPAGVYLNPAGVGNGITVAADNVTLDMSTGAEIQVQTWGQAGIDAIGRSGLTTKGGVVRYVGTRGNHTGSYRGSAPYCNCAGVYINRDRCTVDGLRTIGMPVGVFLSSWNGTSQVDRVGVGNRIIGVETEGMDFGLLYVGQQAMTVKDMYGHDDVDDSGGANPTHVIYGSATQTFRARGASFTGCVAERILFGQPYQMKYHDELVISQMIARDSRGLMNIMGCMDGVISNLVGTGCLANLSPPNGALIVQDMSTARMTFRDVSLVFDQTNGVDQRCAILAGSGHTIDGISIVGKRTSAGSGGAGMLQLIGVGHTARGVRLVDTSGLNPAGIILGDGSNPTTGTIVDDPRISGCARAVDTFGTADGVINYRNNLVSVSQSFTTTAANFLIARDGVIIRGSTPEGAVTAPVGTTVARTDNGQLWIKVTGTGNTGWAAV